MQGIPASGKTTKARELVEKEGYKRVNKDELRNMVDNGKWSESNEVLINEISLSIIHEMLNSGNSVIVDDTNFSNKKLNKLKQIAKIYDASFEIIRLNTPLDECLKRDSERENCVGEKVVRMFYNKYVDIPNEK